MIHVFVSSPDPFSVLLFVAVVTIMLGIMSAGGFFSTADWLCISALFTFLTPFGIHVSVFALLFGFICVILHQAVICVASNVTQHTTFSDVHGRTKWIRLMAFVSCKKRGAFDRFAYPAVNDTEPFEFNLRTSGKKIDYSRRCPYVIPAIPIITHMCAMTLFVILVLFPQSIFS